MNRLSEVLREKSIDERKLSLKSGIDTERLNSLKGGEEPTMSELRAIAAALRLRLDDFRRPTDQEAKTELLFRNARVGGKPIDNLIRSSLSRRIAEPISLVTVRPTAAPSWQGLFARGKNVAEKNAYLFRSYFCNDDQLSPLLSLPQIVEEKMGVVLLVIRNVKVDGASGFLDGVPFVLVSARFRPRMLFTLAHEIGHLITHHDYQTPTAVIDQNVQVNRGVGDDAGFERDANSFASHLLMPAQAVGLALRTIRQVARLPDSELGDLEISYLARIFGVSFWVAAIRCERLGLLPAGGASALNEEVTARYGSPEKRANLAGLPPRHEIRFPSLPKSLLISAVERIKAGELSIGRAAEALEVSIGEIVAAHAGGHA